MTAPHISALRTGCSIPSSPSKPATGFGCPASSSGRLQARLARVRLDERTRLAVELHDTIAQNLTGASFEINAGERLVPTDSGAALKKHLL